MNLPGAYISKDFSKGRWSGRGRLIVIAVVVVLALAGAAYYFLFWNGSEDKPVRSGGQAISIKPVNVQYVQMNEEELTEKVNYLIGTRQYTEAEKLINMQSDISANKTKLSLLMAVQNAAGKETEATRTAAKIAALPDLSAGELGRLARQYKAAGDKKKAVEYFNKAIKAYNTEKQGSYESEVKLLEAELKELQ